MRKNIEIVWRDDEEQNHKGFCIIELNIDTNHNQQTVVIAEVAKKGIMVSHHHFDGSVPKYSTEKTLIDVLKQELDYLFFFWKEDERTTTKNS